MVDRRPVRHRHALGPASGAGGVNGIGQVGGPSLRGRVFRRQPGQAVPVQQYDCRRRGGQAVLHLRLGQQQRRRAVVQHVSQAVERIQRVQRHIRPAGLEDAEQPYDHLQRALRAQRHQRILAPGESGMPNQAVRDAVGLGVQFGVAQTFPATSECDGLGRGLGLGFEQAGQSVIGGISHLRGVGSQQSAALIGGQHSYPMHRQLGLGGQLRQDQLQAPD